MPPFHKKLAALFVVWIFFLTVKGSPVEKTEIKEDACKQPKGNKKGNANLTRFFYDSETRECVTFIYGGKGNNGNNFRSKEECEETCLETVGLNSVPTGELCRLQPDYGTDCSEVFSIRYRFSSLFNTCVRFEYGGCGGNENNFKTKAECMKKCHVGGEFPSSDELLGVAIRKTGGAGIRKDVCNLPIANETCNGSVSTRYYFSNEYFECFVFQYGGCGGNGNNFKTEEECLKTCEVDKEVSSVSTEKYGSNLNIFESLSLTPEMLPEIQSMFGGEYSEAFAQHAKDFGIDSKEFKDFVLRVSVNYTLELILNHNSGFQSDYDLGLSHHYPSTEAMVLRHRWYYCDLKTHQCKHVGSKRGDVDWEECQRTCHPFYLEGPKAYK